MRLGILSPPRPGKFEQTKLEKLDATCVGIAESFGSSNPQLSLVFPTMVDPTTNLSEMFVGELVEEAGGIDGALREHGVVPPIDYG